MAASIKILSWNIQRFSARRISKLLDWVGTKKPDILTLQEVTSSTARALAQAGYDLQVSGLQHAPASLFRRDTHKQPKHGALIAVRSGGMSSVVPTMKWTRNAYFPHLFARARIVIKDLELDVVCAHIPNGSGNG